MANRIVHYPHTQVLSNEIAVTSKTTVTLVRVLRFLTHIFHVLPYEILQRPVLLYRVTCSAPTNALSSQPSA